jgi:hypothetical protein
MGLPDGSFRRSLQEYVGSRWDHYDSLSVKFWPTHSTFGTPDAVLVFTGRGVEALIVVVECKLWASKSGTGLNDQLLRYLRLLEDLGSMQLDLDQDVIEGAVKVVVYLKPVDPLPELLETAALCTSDVELPDALYGLEWQDIVEASDKSLTQTEGITRLVLNDVSTFLKRRGLEYFKGFRIGSLHSMDFGDGSFYRVASEFIGFSLSNLDYLDEPVGRFYQCGEEK